MFRFNMNHLIAVAAGTILLTACGQQAETEKPAFDATQSHVQPAENKMVVLPANMTLASAVIHPPRAKDGFGDTETQTIGAFNGLHNLLKKQNLNLGNVMRVRAVVAADAEGVVDFDGYMSGYKKFFGTEKLPSEPINVITSTNSLPVTGQLIVLEADIAVPTNPKSATAQPVPEQKDKQ
jgi:hypothetical protein